MTAYEFMTHDGRSFDVVSTSLSAAIRIAQTIDVGVRYVGVDRVLSKREFRS